MWFDTPINRYRKLERRLWFVRFIHGDQDGEPAEEESLLDEMEQVWYTLSEDEKDKLTHEGPRCFPLDPSCNPPNFDDYASNNDTGV